MEKQGPQEALNRFSPSGLRWKLTEEELWSVLKLFGTSGGAFEDGKGETDGILLRFDVWGCAQWHAIVVGDTVMF